MDNNNNNNNNNNKQQPRPRRRGNPYNSDDDEPDPLLDALLSSKELLAYVDDSTPALLFMDDNELQGENSFVEALKNIDNEGTLEERAENVKHHANVGKYFLLGWLSFTSIYLYGR